MQISQANIEKLDDVAFLFDQYRVFYQQKSDLEKSKEFIKERLNHCESVIFIATESEHPLGYTQLFPSWSSVSMQRVWILNDLFVLPQHRNQGIAKSLMNQARQYAISTNATRLILATEITNKIGQNLYESMGYSRFHNFYHYILKL